MFYTFTIHINKLTLYFLTRCTKYNHSFREKSEKKESGTLDYNHNVSQKEMFLRKYLSKLIP